MLAEMVVVVDWWLCSQLRKPLHCPWGQGRAGIFIARVQGKSSFYQL
jgi:hypothetical protein